ncbi:MAG: flippase [Actinomycetota bacterium]
MTDEASASPESDLDGGGRLARNIASVGGSQLVTWAFSAVAIVVVPRALGPTALGQLGFASAVWGIGALFTNFGSSALINREVARDRATGSQILSNVLPMQGIAWTAVATVIFGYTLLGDFDSTQATLMFIVGFGALIGEPAQALMAAIIGQERLVLSSALSVVDRALVAIATVAAVLLGYGVEVVAAVGFVGTALVLIVMIGLMRRDEEIQIDLTLRQHRSVINQAVPLMLLGGALVVYREIDVITLKALADDESVGLYSATDRLFGAMLLVPGAVTFALFPTMARRWSSDPEGVLVTLRRICGLLALFTLPVAAGALLLGPQIAVTILGDDFERSGDVMRVYGIVLIPVAWTGVLGMLCQISKRERIWTYVLLASAAATIPLDVVLVPWTDDRFGNAALAGALAFLVTETGAVVYGFRRVLPGVFDAAFRSTIYRTLPALAAMVGVVWFLQDLFILVPVAVGGAVYGLGVLATGAIRLDELATIGGPFERFARFRSNPADPPQEDEAPDSTNPRSRK